jgi:hypothetical protein
MRALHERSRRLALLVTPVVALGIGLSSVPAQATASSPASSAAPGIPASGVTWHKLKLINGWHAGTGFGTGTPRWAVKDGIVYLAGSVVNTHATDFVFAVLPKAARSGHELYINIYTVDYTRGQLRVFPSGQLNVSGPNSSDQAKQFSSLAGVSFLAAHTKGTKLHLRSGWHQGAASDMGGAPSYALRGGVVYLSGVLSDPSGSNIVAAVLPKVARPPQTTYMTIETNLWVPGVVEISPNGNLFIYGGAITSFGSLDGLTFTVGKPASHPLHLVNGWFSPQASDHTGTPSYRVSGGIVYFSGAVRQSTSGGDSMFAVLPKTARPAHNLYISVYSLGGAPGSLEIDANGQMWAAGTSAWVLTSLAGVSFPLKS